MLRRHVPLLSIAALAWAASCNAAFGVDELEPSVASNAVTIGTGGSGGDTTATGGTTGQGGMASGGHGGAGGMGGAGGGMGGAPPGCGDGTVVMGEECDDGNQVDGDMCSATCTVECDPPLVKRGIDNHCYSFETNATLNWGNAVNACAALGPRWYLASITTLLERNFVDARFQSTSYWIGGNDLQVEGMFAWVNGEPWIDNLWGSGEPSGGGENCVEMRSQGQNNDDLMNDQTCAELRSYACEHTPLGL